MAPPLALGEVPEEVRMNKLLGMNAPPAAKVYNEKERYHVEWKDLHMSQEEQDRIAYLRERGAKHVFTCVQVNHAIEGVASMAWRSTRRYEHTVNLISTQVKTCLAPRSRK